MSEQATPPNEAQQAAPKQRSANALNYIVLGLLVVCVLIASVKLFGSTVSGKFASANGGVYSHVTFGEDTYDSGDHYADYPARAPSDDRIDESALEVDGVSRRGEVYETNPENQFIHARVQSTSTFSIDVDNASYTLSRRDLENGALPVPAAVRPEEFINYFDYGYPDPRGAEPFSINLEVAPSRFGEGKHLLRVGLQGDRKSLEELAPTNIVLLVDVSGSMQSERKLPLVIESVEALVESLRPRDTISIVTYAGRDRVLLEPTRVKKRRVIERALDHLAHSGNGGSTNAEAGIVTAYRLAEEGFKPKGNNRVIIMTDGDFNVGKTGQQLFELVDRYRAQGINLTCMGYGLGDYQDYHMENLAKNGNGNYFYVDSIEEAERVFGTDLVSTLEVIAADVKIQVSFDPTQVKRYRLVGYENRVMDNQDFRDDTKDAGEIGPGHTVTAFYELELSSGTSLDSSLAQVRLRYKPRQGASSEELVREIPRANIHEAFSAASAGFQFGAAVAEFAELLRRSDHIERADIDAVINTAARHAGDDPARVELVELARGARELWLSRLEPAPDERAGAIY